MSALDIYNFEGAVEPAVAEQFTAIGLTAYTSSSDVTQQRERPRAEIQFALGAGNQKFKVLAADGSAWNGEGRGWNYRRETLWDCTITISLLTAPDMATHAEYRAKLRSLMACMWLRVNGETTMTRHSLEIVRDGGSSPLMMSQDNDYFRTDFTFFGKVSIQDDAWPQLAT